MMPMHPMPMHGWQAYGGHSGGGGYGEESSPVGIVHGEKKKEKVEPKKVERGHVTGYSYGHGVNLTFGHGGNDGDEPEVAETRLNRNARLFVNLMRNQIDAMNEMPEPALMRRARAPNMILIQQPPTRAPCCNYPTPAPAQSKQKSFVATGYIINRNAFGGMNVPGAPISYGKKKKK